MKFNVSNTQARSSASRKPLGFVSILLILTLLGALLAGCAPAAPAITAPTADTAGTPAGEQLTNPVEATAPAAYPPAGDAAPTTAAAEVIQLKIGASPVPHAEILQYIQDNLAAQAGLELTIIEFTDYVQPNLVL